MRVGGVFFFSFTSGWAGELRSAAVGTYRCARRSPASPRPPSKTPTTREVSYHKTHAQRPPHCTHQERDSWGTLAEAKANLAAFFGGQAQPVATAQCYSSAVYLEGAAVIEKRKPLFTGLWEGGSYMYDLVSNGVFIWG